MHGLTNWRHRITSAVAAAGAVLLGVAALAAPASAAPPANDLIGSFRPVTSVPFYAAQDTRQATSSPNDGECVGGDSVWYRYRPTAGRTIRVVTVGSDYDTVLAVFSGARNSRTLVACSDDAVGAQSAVQVDVAAGTTYWFAVSTCCSPDVNGGGRAVLRVYAPRAGGVQAAATRVETGLVSGRLLVSGTVSCRTPSVAAVYVAASQRNGTRVARGTGSTYLSECTGTTRTWLVRVDSDTGEAFQTGRLVLTVDGDAYDGFVETRSTVDSIVTVVANPNARPTR